MKKFTLVMLAALCAVVIVSCNADYTPPVFNINTPTEIEFNADGTGEYSVISVDANQEWDYVLIPANGWLQASRAGNRITLTAEPNTSVTAPTPVTILFTPAETSPVLVTVKQSAAASILSINPSVDELFFNADGTSDQATTFTVSTNESSWSVTLSPSGGWLSVNKSGNAFTLTAVPNTLPDAPDPVTVTVSAGGAAPVVFTALQAGATSADKYAVGDLWPGADAPEGVVFWLDTTHGEYDPVMKKGTKGKIMSLDEAGLTWGPQSSTGATDMNDGVANMTLVKGLGIAGYPAFKWCADKGDKWYLPALNELEFILCAFNGKPAVTWDINTDGMPSWSPDITAQNAFNATLTGAGGDAVNKNNYYWTSTENVVNTNFAIYIEFADGWTTVSQKTDDMYVRAVAVFE